MAAGAHASVAIEHCATSPLGWAGPFQRPFVRECLAFVVTDIAWSEVANAVGDLLVEAAEQSTVCEEEEEHLFRNLAHKLVEWAFG